MQPPAPETIMPHTMRARSDYGLKIAKRGYDVLYASDNELLYNSSFPVLQIIDYITADTQWEITATGSYQEWNEFSGTLSTRWKHSMRRLHGLNYPPMFVPFGYNAYSSQDKLEWNTKYIYFEKTFFSQTDYDNYIAAGSQTPHGIIFGIDIETDVEYPYVDDGLETEWGQQYDYGIKHILTDDPNTLNPSDLGLNANIQSIMAVAVKVATNANPNVGVYYPSGISASQLAPFCFLKSATTGRWRAGGVSAQAISGYRPAMPRLGIDYYRLDGQAFAEKCSLVVVRSPMIAPDKTDYSFNM
jgi:hypothetical protein